MKDRGSNPYATPEVPTMEMTNEQVAAFRVFLDAVVYTHTFGQRKDMANLWIPMADDLLAQTGQKFVKGMIRPIDWVEEVEE